MAKLVPATEPKDCKIIACELLFWLNGLRLWRNRSVKEPFELSGMDESGRVDQLAREEKESLVEKSKIERL